MNLLCRLRAIPAFLRHGVYAPHDYAEAETYPAIVAATEKGWRELPDLRHEALAAGCPQASEDPLS